MRTDSLPLAILFDLDGTLIDSRHDIVDACNHVLQWARRPALPETTILSFVGDGSRVLVARAFGEPPDSPKIEPFVTEFVRYYEEHPADHTRWMPGAKELLLALRGIKVGLVTNKSRPVVLRVLAKLGAPRAFDTLYAGGDGPLKPDARALLSPLAELRCPPDRAWMVGDATQDIAAAKAAGCKAVAVVGGFQSEEKLRGAAPDILLGSLSELRALIGHSR